MTTSPGEETSITERITVGLLSGIAALLTGALIWFVVFYTLATTGYEYQPPFIPVLIFAALMFLFGFATLSNLVAKILGAIWMSLYRSLRFWE